MRLTRRQFLKLGAGGLIGIAGALGRFPTGFRALAANIDPKETVPVGPGQPGHPWRFVVDIRKCIGCGKCVRACKLENHVPLDPAFNRTWVERYVYTGEDEPLVDSPNAGIDGFSADYINVKYKDLKILKSFFVPKLCNHCQSPPCVQVCPVAATYSTSEGVVIVDRKACIGCRYCVQACPYGARFLDPNLKVVDKCTWCYHRITKGLLPACVEVCPTHARNFGNIEDPESTVSRILREEVLGILKPDLGTKPMVYYVGLERGVH